MSPGSGRTARIRVLSPILPRADRLSLPPLLGCQSLPLPSSSSSSSSTSASPDLVMSCGGKPLGVNGAPPTVTAGGAGVDCREGAPWHRWLPGRGARQSRPDAPQVRAKDGGQALTYRRGGPNQPLPAPLPLAVQSDSHPSKPRPVPKQVSPRAKGERSGSRKENGEAAATRRRPKAGSQTTDPTVASKHRMSYPPYRGASSPAQWDGLTSVKETSSCPVLLGLENLTIAPKKHTPSPDPALHHEQKYSQGADKPKARLVAKHQLNKLKQVGPRRHGEHDRLRVPDATGSRPRQQRRSHQNGRDHRQPSAAIPRPKPPSWQDLASSEAAGTSVVNAGGAVPPPQPQPQPESVCCGASFRCESATTRSTADSERRSPAAAASGRARAHIRRTRSRVIDSREIPRSEGVLPLARTKPSEFHLRETYHDDTVYLLENARRCRKWLAALEESDIMPHVEDEQTDGTDGPTGHVTVTCDVEIAQDKWSFLGSPYPSSSECSSDGP